MKNGTRAQITRAKKILILIVSGIIAVALGLTCGLCFGIGSSNRTGTTSGVESGEVSHSATKALTSAGTYNYTTAGSLMNNDLITMAYCGGIYTLNLPKGTYKFEVWGARGGQYVAGAGTPGYGGYTYGQIVLSGATTIYVVPGGIGTNGDTSNSVKAGGYNGGGAGRYYGSSGGGATHIATASGLLSSLSGNTAAVLMVAGGGGGTQKYNGGHGGGGNSNGGTTNGGCGSGGCGGGLSGPHGNPWQSHNVATNAGSFGQGGGVGAGSDGFYAGAGGGGYWGGCGATSDVSVVDDKGGGGGSGYVNTSKFTNYGGSGTDGNNNGAGRAQITAIQVNQPPVQQSYSITGQNIGTLSTAKAVYSYNLAQDTDYANQSGANANSVYFVNGTTTTDLSSSTAQDTGLYLDAACTIPAGTYITYKFQSNQQFNITGYKKQPRAGVSGVSTNNQLKVYVGIRDMFGGNPSTSTNARGVYSFTITFNGYSGTHKENTSGTLVNGNKYAYRYGKSTSTDPSIVPGGGVYSPKAVGTWSLCVQQPIQKNTSVTITAAELMGMTAPASTTAASYNALFQAVLVPSGAVSGLYAYSGSTVTFNSSVTGYTSITITATGSSPQWQNATFTLYMVEINASTGTRIEPIGITYDIHAIDVNFRVDNTRPTLRSSQNNVVDVPVGGSVDVQLNKYFSDIDGEITASTHRILGVEVPQYEFVELDKYGGVVSTYNASGAAAGSSYYNVAGGTLSDSLTSGKSTKETGFNVRIAQPSITEDAFVSYTIKAYDTLTLTGIRSSYSQYQSTRAAQTAYTGGNTSEPTASGSVTNPGHFYLLMHIQDNNDTADGGIWLPIAVRVGYADGRMDGVTPVNTGTTAGAVSGQGMLSSMPRAVGNVGDEFYFVPMGVNIGNTEYPIGKVTDASGNVLSAGVGKDKVQALALDGDNYTTWNNDTREAGLGGWSKKLNELLTITTPETFKVSETERAKDYAKIERISVYIPKSYFGGRVAAVTSGGSSRDAATGVNTVVVRDGGIANDDTEYYVIDGLKVTLLSATMGRYFYVNVGISDSNQKAVNGGVNIAINVANTDPDVIDEGDIAKYTGHSDNPFTYKYEAGQITVSYRVPMRSTFFITPYDLISDENMLDGGAVYPAGGFTLNGLSGKYVNGVFTERAEAGNGETQINALFNTGKYGRGSETYVTQLTNMLENLTRTRQTVGSVATGYAFGTAGVRDTNVLNDRLFFVRTSDTTSDPYTFNPTTKDYVYTTTNTADYVGIAAGNTVNINGVEYSVDFLMFTAETRTATNAVINLTVRDRYGAVAIPVRIEIAIINTAPQQIEIEKVPELAVKAVDGDNGPVYETSLVVTPDGVMTDADGDRLVFVQSRGILVARGLEIAKIENVSSLMFDGFGSAGNHPEYAEYLSDKHGNLLTDYYLTARMDSTSEFTVTALGSTKNIEEGVYVYFFVTDSRGGTTLGYLPVEVVNTRPHENTSDVDGFSGEDRLWSLESARIADTYRSRYIVGSEAAREQLKEKEKATDADIKLIAMDADALHGKYGVMLSQRGATASVYFNYDERYNAPPYGNAYEVAVPNVLRSVSGGFDDTKPAAVVVCAAPNDGKSTYMLPEYVSVQVMFYVNGKWYERSVLIGELSKDSGEVKHEDVFDGEGRFVINDWAVKVATEQAFTGYRLQLTFSVRDDVLYGGDTADKETAYNSNRNDKKGEKVAGRLDVGPVYMYISGTGIRTKDEFGVYDNNYVVDYEPKDGTSKSYLVTKTGETVSAVEYSAAAAASAKGKFEYLSTITVPASSDGSKAYPTVYVPMSYFGQKQALVAPSTQDKTVSYQDTFVGYDMRKSNGDDSAYDIGHIDNIASAISLYDGNTTWRGMDLADNPYLEIASVNYMSGMNGAAMFGGAYSSMYYNTQLAVSTADQDYSGVSEDEFIAGTEKQLIYLKDQKEKLLEHNFGLSFKKKNMRTGSVNLQLTINLALSEVKRGSGNEITGMTTACESASDARTVTVFIRIENTPIDLVTGKVSNSDKYLLGYDDTYHVDFSLNTNAAIEFELLRSDGNDAGNAQRNKIYYTDNDYSSNKYRDAAYFSIESVNGLSGANNKRPSDNNGDAYTNTTLAKTGEVMRAQNSMRHYYGVASIADTTSDAYTANGGKYSYSSYFNVTTSESGKVLNIRASRKTYINESALEGIVKTEFVGKAEYSELFGGFNWNAGKTYGGLSYKQLRKVYETRGLKVVFGGTVADENTAVPDDETLSAYYPLNVIVYDNCGAGWSDASYVAMEFRITIINTAPTINTESLSYNDARSRWEKHTKLAVGSTMYLELEKYISDPDIFTINSQLATVNQFNSRATGIDKETGDYLESLFSYNYTKYASDEAAQSALLSNRAGLSKQGYTGADVIMYMEVEGNAELSTETVPANNRLWFRVNRRTSDDDGNIRDSFEFTLSFRDNHHTEGTPSETLPITFVIEIDNQAPVIDTAVTKVTMHSGDSLVLLPAYYDTFIGGTEYLTDHKTFDKTEHGSDYALPREGSTAYLKSKTYNNYYNVRLTEGADWTYHELTRAACKDFKTDTSNGNGNQSLGFLGVASDDAPWRLRFETKSYNSYSFITVTQQNLVYPELRTGTPSERLPMALLIEARNACTQQTVTFEITDGEGGRVTYTLEFTIISAPPRPLDPNVGGENARLEAAHLEGIENTGSGANKYLNNGTYNMYIIPSGDAKGVAVELETFGKKTAYRETEIKLNNVAIDPDSATATLSLYDGGRFRVDNQDLIEDGQGHYTIPNAPNYFYITKRDNTAFTVHATGYNPSKAYETLTFRVGDPGNDVYANSIEITIRVYTIYSDMENPTVGKMSLGKYEDEYLAGSNVFSVKPYDEYLGTGAYAGNPEYAASAGVPSTYKYIYFGGDEGNDATLTDGKAESPIIDRDVSVSGTQSYAAYVYAFMENGEALDKTEIGKLLERNGNLFSIRADKKTAVENYLIGGINASGNSVTPNRTALENVSKYFGFTVAADGTSIAFTPKTATLGTKIMLYVDVQKIIGTRDATRIDEAVSAGTLFALEVEDSAPRGVKLDGKDYAREFEGGKGDTVSYRIFGGTRGEALFEDSDVDDEIEVKIANDTSDSWYRNDALKKALDEDENLDWAVNAAMGKARAIDVEVIDGYVKITINRRMDKRNADGTYAKSVTFPLVLTCEDRAGKTAQVTIKITVNNSGMTAKDEYSAIDEKTGAGYAFSKNTESQYTNEYNLNVNVLKGVDLEIDITDFLVDTDYVKGANVDSYRFVPRSGRSSSFEDLLSEPKKAIYYTDAMLGRPQDLATVTPIYTEYGGDLSYTKISVNAESSVRNSKGSLRIHIIDRAGDATSDSEGIYITLNITVINTAPEVIPGKNGSEIDILGSDKATTGETFYLKDFVRDDNESDIVDMANAPIDQRGTQTWLRIYSVRYLYYTSINATSSANVPSGGADYIDDSSLIFTVSYSEQDTGNEYGQAFKIRPNIGFYGSGEFVVTVYDGNINDYPDSEWVEFTVKVNVVYNPEDIDSMGIDPMARGKRKTVDIEALVNDIDNKFEPSGKDSDNGIEEVDPEAPGSERTFNPASWYTLVSIIPTTDATAYVEAKKVEDGLWELHALQITDKTGVRIRVVYALKADVEKAGMRAADDEGEQYTTYESYFDLVIKNNERPSLIYNKMTFSRYAEEGAIPDMFRLDANNSVYIAADQLFDDPEDDELKLISVRSNKESLVSAKLSKEKDKIVLKFNARGDAKITVTLSDESGANYTYDEITVINTDLPEPDLWTRFLASLESNKVMWALIFGSAALLLIVLIIIVVIIKKRKRVREELEALLVSEMEIEEQMLRLSGGPSPTGYQSYGYLQPPTAPQPDPSTMLGAGSSQPQQQQLGLAAPPPQGTQTEVGNQQPPVMPNNIGNIGNGQDDNF
ncbi:MAG: hypothetical protein J1G38_02720 [Clostridiales bacterium]|nr:hypothetical protein [Clostridiales bacterium]